jgi:hypothetical protein
MTTVTTQQPHQHRVPWIASAAVAVVIAGAGLVGLAVHNAGDSTDQGPSLRTPTAQDYAQYQRYYPGAGPYDGVDGHVPPPPPPAQAGSGDGSPGTTSGGQTQIGP